MATQINTGTASGLIEFLDYLIERGYGSPGAVTPLKSAANRVLDKVEGGGDLASVDIREMDVDDYLNRFATLARADYKQESIAAYRNRFTRAVDYYRAFLQDGSVPKFPGRGSRARRDGGGVTPKPKPAAKSSERSGHHVASPGPAQGAALVDYPFPLSNGQLAYVRLPKRFEKKDAERMSAFLMALAFDAPRELPPGEEED
jgi:hypothetical protein